MFARLCVKGEAERMYLGLGAAAYPQGLPKDLVSLTLEQWVPPGLMFPGWVSQGCVPLGLLSNLDPLAWVVPIWDFVSWVL